MSKVMAAVGQIAGTAAMVSAAFTGPSPLTLALTVVATPMSPAKQLFAKPARRPPL